MDAAHAAPEAHGVGGAALPAGPMPAGSAGAPIDPEALVRRADELFLSAGLTCSEAILQAGCEALGIEDPLVPGIALGLGGGVGQQGATCGILTGAALCISAAIIRTRPDTAYQEKKRRVMAATGTVFRAFQAEFGQTECRRICGLDLRAPTVTAGAKATIRVRVCAPRLAACARVLAGVLNELAAQRQ